MVSVVMGVCFLVVFSRVYGAVFFLFMEGIFSVEGEGR